MMAEASSSLSFSRLLFPRDTKGIRIILDVTLYYSRRIPTANNCNSTNVTYSPLFTSQNILLLSIRLKIGRSWLYDFSLRLVLG
mmetsp:Transcript_5053/g.7126  ORF Transcript_5053/g.7126 Transcript_5053/m.7126 type:complete len:84 (+) Transcript_5053:1-252(+)